MRILTNYITRDFIITFVVTLFIFLFVMAVGNIFRVIDLFSRGVSGLFILKVFSYGMPFSLIFAIPMSVLASAFLQFSRLSSDNEIVTMKACGVSVWQIIQSPIIISLVLCIVCIYINCSLAPKSHYARRTVLGKIGMETPLKLIDEGRFIRDFPGLYIYIGKKNGQTVHDIVVYQIGEKGVKQTVRAESGTVGIDPRDVNSILINLFRVRIDQLDEDHPNDLTRARHMTAEEYPVRINVEELINRDMVWKKRADLTIMELISGIRNVPLFSRGDFFDLDILAAKLKKPADPVSQFINTHLSENSLHLLNTYDRSELQRNELAKALVTEFNRLVFSTDLYNTELFKHVNLTEKTRTLLDQHPKGRLLMSLNRMLLEDAYPVEIVRTPFSNLSAEDLAVHRMSLMVEASTRLALSFSCFAFVLLGASLGMKMHRKESSAGIAITLLLVFVFYFFIIIADSLVSHPELQPHLIVWIPFLAAEGLGFYLLYRSN